MVSGVVGCKVGLQIGKLFEKRHSGRVQRAPTNGYLSILSAKKAGLP